MIKNIIRNFAIENIIRNLLIGITTNELCIFFRQENQSILNMSRVVHYE